METYLVGTGVVRFAIEAESPRRAIEKLKNEIRARERARSHPTIGLSLVNALKAGTLNFIVFDSGRNEILAGELNGEYLDTPTRRLADAFPTMVPADLYYRLPLNNRT